jgi:4-amino-4-deoxy-L-arabinose transferase-like glycosyltransferase
MAAAVLRPVGTTFSDPPPSVLQLRAFNVVLGAATLVVAYFAAREVLPRPLAVVVPALMVGVPMFTSVSAAVSADPLANLLSASIVLVLARRLRTCAGQHDNRTWSIRTGVLVGLGVLTKLAVGIFVPLAVLVACVTSARRVRDSALLLATAGVVVLPWLVHQVTTYGWLDPLATGRHAAVVLDQQRFTGLTPEYVGRFLTVSFHSFWAQFGWMGVIAPDRLYWLWGAFLIVAVAGLIVHWRRLAQPVWLLMVGTLVAALLGYIAYNLAFEQFQGRYLFTALVPIACLLVVGVTAWLPRAAQAWGATLAAVALIGLNAYALMKVLVPGFAATG